MYRENLVKRRLAEGKPSLGCWLGLGDPVAAEVVGLCGYTAAVVDNEHGPASLDQTVGMLQALSATPAAGIVRVPWNDAVYVKRVLDIGAEGLMFPSIGSAEEARAAVAACRYPPAGLRGCAYPVARAADYGLRAEEYRDHGHEDLLVICQIETAEAVEAIPEIAAVPGVDMLFIGPYDLSGSIGRLGRFGDPAVMALFEKAEQAVLDSGRWYGTIAFPGRSVADLVGRDCRLILAGHDIALLRDGALAQVRAFRAAAHES